MSSAVRVRAMRPADLDEAADVLARAFAEGTNLASFVPLRRRRERLRRFFVVSGDTDALVDGVAEVAVGGLGPDERILAVAWWHPPLPAGTGRAAALRSGRSWRELRTALLVFGVRRLPAAVRSRAASRRARPHVAHWHLAYLASRSEPAARGAATALLRHRLAVADAQGIGSHLEGSSRSTVGFYERLGWRVTGPVPGPGGRGTTAMWRPAGGP